jgi:hypothetical protein
MVRAAARRRRATAGCDSEVSTGSCMAERAMRALCMQKVPGGHFYRRFWQAFPKGFRRPKATTFTKFPSGDGALVAVAL